MKYNDAFTLIETLIVLLLIGIGFMAVTSRFSPRVFESRRKNLVIFFNDILEKSYNVSKKLGRPVFITGFEGSPNIILPDGRRVKIPGDRVVSSVIVNDVENEGVEYRIYVYPDRISDYFKITFSDGSIIESIPLLLKARKI